jgi:thioredoxin reductase (NADPH)
MSEPTSNQAVTNPEREVRDLVIIGSGPAGYTAAVYAARAELKPLVLEGSVTAGGALMNTTEVENFPGFPAGVLGPDLMESMREQAERFGAELVTDDAVEVDLTGEVKRVVAGDGQTYYAHAVVLALGSAYRELGLEGEKRLSGRGVSWCATCDGFFFKGRDVVVAGGGDSAMEEAMFLTRFADSVTVVHRRDELRASKIMRTRAEANEKIRFLLEHEVVGVNGEAALESVSVLDKRSGETREFSVGALFVAIGHEPRTALVKGQVDLDENGFIVVEGRSGRTSLPGVFAAGDVVDHTYMQAITAAGSGCAAALDAEKFLAARGDVPQGAQPAREETSED